MYVLCLESFASGLSSLADIAKKLDEVYEWGTPARPDFVTWGQSESARESAKAMFRLVSAGRRDRVP